MKLLVQPGDGLGPVLKGIGRAKECVEVVIFRCDLGEIEKALAAAVSRGVHVHALITYSNRGGEKNLRNLELRLLGAGVTVARTDGDLPRYHDKMMIVDRRELYMLAFNFTRLDVAHSRSFGIITEDRRLVQEAARLFDADSKRQPYEAAAPGLVVSPANAREELSAFIQGAKKRLLIYDPEVSDPAMIRLLQEKAKEGVEIRILGRLISRRAKLPARKMAQLRLHTRTFIRDGRLGFIGSQSLRKLELDSRREVGLIFRDPKIVSRLETIFEEDWALTEMDDVRLGKEESMPAAKVAKKVAKAVARELPPVTPVVEGTVREVAGEKSGIELNPEEVEETVRDAVKEAVKQAVREVVASSAK
jgi:cardiolipin synthase